MLTRTTVIGICIGAVILGIGVASMILNSPFLHTKNIEETIGVEKLATYEFTAPKSSHQNFNATGEKFHVKLQTPSDGLQVDEDFKKEVMFDWFVLKEGTNKIEIKNTGESEIIFQGKFAQYGDPTYLAHNLLLLITGVIIIGLSGAFSIRKPKGF
ncbi:MAG: hypothetical protein HW420_1368 [Candidatus Nitrosotenuis sp.]|nr:hypothetical protein [Candidatus Nitrosotenuis sp.]